MTDNKPEITVRFGFPTRLGHPVDESERHRVTLEIGDEVSRLTILTLDLTAEQFRDALAGSQVKPHVEFAHPHPERWGHEMTMWTENFPHDQERQALAFRKGLEAAGWSVGSGPLTRTNSSSAKFVVTGRRWDGGEPGVYCHAHHRLVPQAHHCYECAVAP